MRRVEHMPKRLGTAVVLLVSLLLVSLQQQGHHGRLSGPVEKTEEAAKPLSFTQGTDAVSHFGVVNDSHLALAALLAFALLLALFPKVQGLQGRPAAPSIPPRNFHCIVPKGP